MNSFFLVIILFFLFINILSKKTINKHNKPKTSRPTYPPPIYHCERNTIIKYEDFVDVSYQFECPT